MNYLAQVNIGSTFGSPFGVTNTLGDLVSLLLKASFTVAGLLVLFFIAFAGFQMIAGAGSGNPESAKKGREAATAAVLGFVIIFVAYWIVRIIEIITGLKLIS